MLLGAKRTNLALEDTLSCLDAECKPSALGNVTENKEHLTPAASVRLWIFFSPHSLFPSLF